MYFNMVVHIRTQVFDSWCFGNIDFGHPNIPNWNKKDFLHCYNLDYTLKCCLRKENFEKLIFINKNWQSNPHVGCPKFSNFAIACEVELNLTKELAAEFEPEVECNFFLKVKMVVVCCSVIYFCFVSVSSLQLMVVDVELRMGCWFWWLYGRP